MHADYLIVGQVIAGTVLSFTLSQRGKRVIVVDDPAQPGASGVAAGIFNPITGQRFVKTWMADALFPYLRSFYRHLEQEMGTRIFYKRDMIRPFVSIEEQNTWIAGSAAPEMQPFAATDVDTGSYASILHSVFGGIRVLQAGNVDVAQLLATYRTYLQTNDAYIAAPFSYDDLQITETSAIWNGIVANKIVFCEGTYVRQNPYFQWLPVRPSKGEILTVSIPELATQTIINRGVFVLPVGDGMHKVGATYTWNDADWQPTQPARAELEDKLQKLIKVPYRVMAHEAGIRPASPDRRPIMGLHPEIPQLGVFNGLGSKGVSLAPYFARQFADYLESGKELPGEVQLSRFFSLYYTSKTHS